MNRDSLPLPSKIPRNDEFPLTAFERESTQGSWRGGLQSFSVSLVLHILLFLIPIGWMISNQVGSRESYVILSDVDAKLIRLEPMEDVPLEFPTVEPLPPTRFHKSHRDEQDPLPPISLPPLRNAKPVAQIPSPADSAPQTEKTGVSSESVSEVLEKEVQKRLDREGAKSGAIQISLMWNNGNDLDLYVQTPVGDIIAFNYKRSRCGGELDVDMNAKKTESTKPVENVFWSAKKAPFGVFVIGAHEYQNHGFREPNSFLVSVKVDGEVRHFRGSIRLGKAVKGVCKFKRTAKGVVFLETPATFAGNKNGKPVFK